MWSHYADCHRGFVIGFDSRNSFFSPNNNRGKDGLKKVVYSDNRPTFPKHSLEYASSQEINKINTEIFFTKSKD